MSSLYKIHVTSVKIITSKISFVSLISYIILCASNAPMVDGDRRERTISSQTEDFLTRELKILETQLMTIAHRSVFNIYDRNASLVITGKTLDREMEDYELFGKKLKREVVQENCSSADVSAGKYGIINLNNINSKCYSNECPLVPIKDISENLNDKSICVQARLHLSRARGKRCFIVLRQQGHTIQGFLQIGPSVSKNMLKFVSQINRESIIKVFGKIQKTSVEIKSCTSKWAEITVEEVWIISESEILPIQVIDCARKDKSPLSPKTASNNELNIYVSQDKKLDHRILDLRTPANQAIFRLESAMSQLFRQCLIRKGFIEIHTPKIISSASESGADVFEVPYFKTTAYLAQSPQLYKQMAIASDFEKVFTVGSVFRAENSHTSWHLTEFIGLDLEMTFEKHYTEVLDVIEQTFIEIFRDLQRDFKDDIEAVSEQFDAQPFEFVDPPPRITYLEANELLKGGNFPFNEVGDLTPQMEKFLGSVIKNKYKTDFFVLYKYPTANRPFYTMPDAKNPMLSNSYDIFMRGEEVMSGAQRIHNSSMLKNAATQHGINVDNIIAYIDAFRFGCAPHAGGGIGLERTIALFLGLDNVRKTSMFPRDPSRIVP